MKDFIVKLIGLFKNTRLRTIPYKSTDFRLRDLEIAINVEQTIKDGKIIMHVKGDLKNNYKIIISPKINVKQSAVFSSVESRKYNPGFHETNKESIFILEYWVASSKNGKQDMNYGWWSTLEETVKFGQDKITEMILDDIFKNQHIKYIKEIK